MCILEAAAVTLLVAHSVTQVTGERQCSAAIQGLGLCVHSTSLATRLPIHVLRSAHSRRFARRGDAFGDFHGEDPRLIQSILDEAALLTNQQQLPSPNGRLALLKTSLLAPISIPALGTGQADDGVRGADAQLSQFGLAGDGNSLDSFAQAQPDSQTRELAELAAVRQRLPRGMMGMMDDFHLEREMRYRRHPMAVRVVGNIAGDLVGILVAEAVRKMGDLAGDIARIGVKELTTMVINTLLRMTRLSATAATAT